MGRAFILPLLMLPAGEGFPLSSGELMVFWVSFLGRTLASCTCGVFSWCWSNFEPVGSLLLPNGSCGCGWAPHRRGPFGVWPFSGPCALCPSLLSPAISLSDLWGFVCPLVSSGPCRESLRPPTPAMEHIFFLKKPCKSAIHEYTDAQVFGSRLSRIHT